jgi:hypothetical protein
MVILSTAQLPVIVSAVLIDGVARQIFATSVHWEILVSVASSGA